MTGSALGPKTGLLTPYKRPKLKRKSNCTIRCTRWLTWVPWSHASTWWTTRVIYQEPTTVRTPQSSKVRRLWPIKSTPTRWTGEITRDSTRQQVAKSSMKLITIRTTNLNSQTRILTHSETQSQCIESYLRRQAKNRRNSKSLRVKCAINKWTNQSLSITPMVVFPRTQPLCLLVKKVTPICTATSKSLMKVALQARSRSWTSSAKIKHRSAIRIGHLRVSPKLKKSPMALLVAQISIRECPLPSKSKILPKVKTQPPALM